MQVPVVMTTSLGQKISTVAVQQPTGTTAAAGHTTLLTNTAAGNTNSQQKVCNVETLTHHSGVFTLVKSNVFI